MIGAANGSIPRNLLGLASHEAGQAVVGRKLSLACGGITILPRHKNGNGTGNGNGKGAILPLPPNLATESAASLSLLQRYCIATLAGPKAEHLLSGHSERGEEESVRYLLLHVRAFSSDARADNNWRFQRAKLNHIVTDMVLACLSEIELVAHRVMERGSLSEREINSMLVDESHSQSDYTRGSRRTAFASLLSMLPRADA